MRVGGEQDGEDGEGVVVIYNYGGSRGSGGEAGEQRAPP